MSHEGEWAVSSDGERWNEMTHWRSLIFWELFTLKGGVCTLEREREVKWRLDFCCDNEQRNREMGWQLKEDMVRDSGSCYFCCFHGLSHFVVFKTRMYIEKNKVLERRSIGKTRGAESRSHKFWTHCCFLLEKTSRLMFVLNFSYYFVIINGNISCLAF